MGLSLLGRCGRGLDTGIDACRPGYREPLENERWFAGGRQTPMDQARPIRVTEHLWPAAIERFMAAAPG